MEYHILLNKEETKGVQKESSFQSFSFFKG